MEKSIHPNGRGNTETTKNKTKNVTGNDQRVIVADSDYDGLISSFLISKVCNVPLKNIVFSNVTAMKYLDYQEGTIIVDLPFKEGCIHYDHHKGSYGDEMPSGYEKNMEYKSTAHLIYEMHKKELKKYLELVESADRVDCAEFLYDKVERPEYVISQALSAGSDVRMNILKWLEKGASLEEIKYKPEIMENYEQKLEFVANMKKQIRYEYKDFYGQKFAVVMQNYPVKNKQVLFDFIKEGCLSVLVTKQLNPDRLQVKVLRPRNCPDFDRIIENKYGKAYPAVGVFETLVEDYKDDIKKVCEEIAQNVLWTRKN